MFKSHATFVSTSTVYLQFFYRDSNDIRCSYIVLVQSYLNVNDTLYLYLANQTKLNFKNRTLSTGVQARPIMSIGKRIGWAHVMSNQRQFYTFRVHK